MPIIPEQQAEFPTGRRFLDQQQMLADAGSEGSDKFTATLGEKLPASVEGLGTVTSFLYQAACCAWGCRGGDHQIEWLTGRVVNQTLGSYRLVRAGYYDEALMLIRGIGEIANLVTLFHADAAEFSAWKSASRRDRLNTFGPAAVRKRLEGLGELGAPIDEDRYRRLCEVGTHPVPGFAPGHYTASGNPILGVISQPVGIYVCVTELSYAVAIASFPLARLLEFSEERWRELGQEALRLIRSLGAFTILSYEKMLANVLKGQSNPSQ